MLCPNCGKENPEGFRFCGHCSAPLEREFERDEKGALIVADRLRARLAELTGP
jgi:predicted amidophosphoribosyltransferase